MPESLNDKIKELLNRPGNEERKKKYEDKVKEQKELSNVEIDEKGMKKLKKRPLPEETRLELERIALVQQQDKLKAEQYRQERIQRARAAMAEKRKNDPAWNYTIQTKEDSETESDEEDNRNIVSRAASRTTATVTGAAASAYNYLFGEKDEQARLEEERKKKEDEAEAARQATLRIQQQMLESRNNAEALAKTQEELRRQQEITRKKEEEARESARKLEEEKRKKAEAARELKEQQQREAQRKKELQLQQQQQQRERDAKKAAEERERKLKADDAERKRMLEEQAELAKKAAAAQSAQAAKANVPPDVQAVVDLYGENSAIANNAWTGVDYPLRRLIDNYKTKANPNKPLTKHPTNEIEAATKVVNAATLGGADKGGLNKPEMFVFLYGVDGNTGFYMGAEMQPDGTPFTNKENYVKGTQLDSNSLRDKIRKLVSEARAGRLLKAEKEMDSEGPTPVRPVGGREEPNLTQIQQTPVKQKTKPASTNAPKKSKKKSAFAKRYDEIKDQKGNYRKLQTLAKDMGVGGKGKATEIKKRIEEGIRRGKLMDSGIDLDYSLSCHRDKKKKGEVMLTGYDSEGDELTKPTGLICPTLGLADRKLMELIV